MSHPVEHSGNEYVPMSDVEPIDQQVLENHKALVKDRMGDMEENPTEQARIEDANSDDDFNVLYDERGMPRSKNGEMVNQSILRVTLGGLCEMHDNNSERPTGAANFPASFSIPQLGNVAYDGEFGYKPQPIDRFSLRHGDTDKSFRHPGGEEWFSKWDIKTDPSEKPPNVSYPGTGKEYVIARQYIKPHLQVSPSNSIGFDAEKLFQERGKPLTETLMNGPHESHLHKMDEDSKHDFRKARWRYQFIPRPPHGFNFEVWKEDAPKLIVISGKMGAGKDTLADMIKQRLPFYQTRAFATKLKKLVALMFGVPENPTRHEKDNLRIGEFTLAQMYQRMGDHMRSYDQDVFANAVYNDPTFPEFAIVTDCRLLNEATISKSKGAFLVRINGDPAGLQAQKIHSRPTNHASEIELDNFVFDYTIENDGTLEDLYESMMRMMAHNKYMTYLREQAKK